MAASIGMSPKSGIGQYVKEHVTRSSIGKCEMEDGKAYTAVYKNGNWKVARVGNK